MTVKERIIRFVKSLGIGQGAFEKEVGLSNGYVNNIRKSIQPDKLQKISLRYPELNTGWLMTGEGEMLKSQMERQNNEETQSIKEDNASLISSVIKMVETADRNSVSIQEMAAAFNRNSKTLEKLVDLLIQNGINIPDGIVGEKGAECVQPKADKDAARTA